jgi:hypothetical protein
MAWGTGSDQVAHRLITAAASLFVVVHVHGLFSDWAIASIHFAEASAALPDFVPSYAGVFAIQELATVFTYE